MKINLKVRFRNPLFIAHIIVSIITPILAYSGLTAQDITSWNALGTLLFDAISNPYVLALVIVSVYNATIDFTTKGVSDSDRAMTYELPKGDD